MRRIGTLPDSTLARRFCDYLVTLSIDSFTDAESETGQTPWNVWIRDEKDVDRAREELGAFEKSPDDQRYQVEGEASRLRNERIASEQRRIKQQKKLVKSMPVSRGGGFGPLSGSSVRQQSIPVTIGIIAISIIASFATNFGRPHSPGRETTVEQKIYYGLSFVDRREYIATDDPYHDLRRGEVWRIFTPMFMHGDAMHLAFNMLWVFFLGSAIERLHGSLFFLLLALGTHAVGAAVVLLTTGMDFLPETLQGSPFSIGASGAVYGLFGYLWIRPLVDPDYPIRLVPMNVVLMLGWLVLCMTPWIENVANGAHLGGLAAGMLVAVIWRRHGNG
jgi:GlpG protein